MTQVAAQPLLDDRKLLDRFLSDRSHGAFEQIVRRYVDLVYATSLRRVRDRHLAEDVTQATFIVLSQRAHTISASTPLPAWLHRTACYAANNALKMQHCRAKHEQQAAMEHPIYRIERSDSWPEIEPLLDEALNRLSTTDRAAVLLRYYQSQSIEEVARTLNLSLEAAKKRLQRELAKLRSMLASKGLALPLVALTSELEANASVIGAAPAIVIAYTAAAAAAAASAPPAVTLISKGAITMLLNDHLRTIATWIVASLFLVGGVASMLPRFIGRAVTRQQNIATPTTEPAARRFSDVIELTVNDDGLRKDECIDFDKGVLVTGPQRAFASRDEGARWFRESGADCHAETQTGEAGLYAMEMAVVPVERVEWDNMSADELTNSMADARPQRQLVSSEADLPVTFAFKTREGGVGIAQLVAMDRGGADEHGNITVRFKLAK